MSVMHNIVSSFSFKLWILSLCSSVHTLLFSIPPRHAFCYPVSSVCIFCSCNTQFLKWIMLQIHVNFFYSDNVLSTDLLPFPSLNVAVWISHSVSTQAALFRFIEALYKTVTNITVSGQVQTEVVRKFTGSNVIGNYPSAIAVTDLVEQFCVGLGVKLHW